jgi:hypothetical protein
VILFIPPPYSTVTGGPPSPLKPADPLPVQNLDPRHQTAANRNNGAERSYLESLSIETKSHSRLFDPARRNGARACPFEGDRTDHDLKAWDQKCRKKIKDESRAGFESGFKSVLHALRATAYYKKFGVLGTRSFAWG